MAFREIPRRTGAAVDHLVHQQAAGFAHVDRLDELEGGGIFDPALGIACRQGNIGDDAVMGIGGIERAVVMALEDFKLRILRIGRAGFDDEFRHRRLRRPLAPSPRKG